MRRKSRETASFIEYFVNQYFDENKCTPSLRRIETELKISRQTVYRYLKDMHCMGILFYDGNRILTEHIRSVTSSTIRKIPVLGEISCGLPFSEYQTDYEYMDIPESFLDDGEYFVLKANGDSMKDVGIDHEDSVIIKVQIYADIGDIVVALDQNGQNTLNSTPDNKSEQQSDNKPEVNGQEQPEQEQPEVNGQEQTTPAQSEVKNDNNKLFHIKNKGNV